jgi:nucleolar protein 12
VHPSIFTQTYSHKNNTAVTTTTTIIMARKQQKKKVSPSSTKVEEQSTAAATTTTTDNNDSYKVGDITSLLGGNSTTATTDVFGSVAQPTKPQETISNKRLREEDNEATEDDLLLAYETPARELNQTNRRKKPKYSQDQIDERRVAKKQKGSDRKLFVGNISIVGKKRTKIQQDLKNLFSQYGKVEAVIVRSLAVNEDFKVRNKRIAIINNQVDEKKKPFGNAYIIFAEDQGDKQIADILKSAIEGSNGKLFEGRHLTVDVTLNADGSFSEYKKISTDDHKKSVFIGNLPFDVDDEEIWQLFENKLGLKVLKVRVIRDRETQRGKGFGYVMLADSDSVGLAVTKSENFYIRDFAIRIKKSNPNADKIKEAKEKREAVKEEKRQAQIERSKHAKSIKVANAVLKQSGESNPYSGLKADKDEYLAKLDKQKNLKNKIVKQAKMKNKFHKSAPATQTKTTTTKSSNASGGKHVKFGNKKKSK